MFCSISISICSNFSILAVLIVVLAEVICFSFFIGLLTNFECSKARRTKVIKLKYKGNVYV